MHMDAFYLTIDPYLIRFYRITGHAFVDFFIGTFVLAFLTLMIGEVTLSLVFLAIRKRIEKITDEVIRYQNLSVDALAARDKEAYLAANKLANDAFGKSFFAQFALSAGLIWPIFFALGWLQQRFAEVEFPFLFTDSSVGPICVFITLYAAAYLIFRRLKYRLPYFRRMQSILDTYRSRSRGMKSFEDLCPPKRPLTGDDSTNGRPHVEN
jgi:hypothetical protein